MAATYTRPPGRGYGVCPYPVEPRSQFGGALDHVTREALRTWGLEPDGDPAVLQIGSTQEIFAAMGTGAVDAGPMAAPLHSRAPHEGYRVLVDPADTGVLYPQTVLTATRAHPQAHDAQTLDFLRGLAEAPRHRAALNPTRRVA
jgi:ABC-type nitrate/sulfonate/bicarbonate transport system substrate-binding protein